MTVNVKGKSCHCVSKISLYGFWVFRFKWTEQRKTQYLDTVWYQYPCYSSGARHRSLCRFQHYDHEEPNRWSPQRRRHRLVHFRCGKLQLPQLDLPGSGRNKVLRSEIQEPLPLCDGRRREHHDPASPQSGHQMNGYGVFCSLYNNDGPTDTAMVFLYVSAYVVTTTSTGSYGYVPLLCTQWTATIPLPTMTAMWARPSTQSTALAPLPDRETEPYERSIDKRNEPKPERSRLLFFN